MLLILALQDRNPGSKDAYPKKKKLHSGNSALYLPPNFIVIVLLFELAGSERMLGSARPVREQLWMKRA